MKLIAFKLMVVAFLTTIFFISPALCFQEADLEDLEEAGLSENTVQILLELQSDKSRRRPAITTNEVLGLLKDGFDEKHVRQFIELDKATAQNEKLPITPAQARELVKADVSFKTVSMMLKAEIDRRVSGREKNDAPRGTDYFDPYANKEKNEGSRKYSVGENDEMKLEREVVFTPEGRKIIKHQSGYTGDLQRRKTTKPDGHKVIIYSNRGPEDTNETNRKRQEEEFRRAWLLLREIQLNVYR